MNANDPLVRPAAARELIISSGAVALDCRFRLSDPEWGRAAYRESRLPGARYADLDRDLADLSRAGLGRHPLPAPEAFAAALGRWGVTHDRPVIVYDDAGGAIAARAWWLLRQAGHGNVRVLDGGLEAWIDAGFALETEESRHAASDETWGWGEMPTMDTARLQDALARERILLVDARGRPRFEGREEPLDRVAGHVPGAVNRPFADNLREGRFKDRAELRNEWDAVGGGQDPARVVHMCGSGVTACHNLLAMEAAGLPGSILYWPSWSGWIEDPGRPVATD